MRTDNIRAARTRGWSVLCLMLAAIVPACSPTWANDLAPPHETLRIESKAMAERRRINVYLPPGYDQRSLVSYPVLYMPDGGEQEDFPHVAATVDRLVRAGEIRPMLVVGIENTQRRRDMTGPTQVEKDRKIAPQVGGSAAFRRFIATELVPVVRARYRVNDEAAIIGESLAGLFVIETLFVQPDLFDTYIALDPSLWWNDEQWPKQASERLQRPFDAVRRLYLASGDAEKTNALQVGHMADALRAHAGPTLHWQYELRPGLRHDTIYRGLEESLLRTLFAVDAASTAASPEGGLHGQ